MIGFYIGTIVAGHVTCKQYNVLVVVIRCVVCIIFKWSGCGLCTIVIYMPFPLLVLCLFCCVRTNLLFPLLFLSQALLLVPEDLLYLLCGQPKLCDC